MNRDELISRTEKDLINQDKISYYPVDNLAGGTWFGFNSKAVVMALLNRYQDKSIETNTSRGIIIPNMLTSTNYDKDLKLMLSKNINPFDLIIIYQGICIKYSWNGYRLSKIELKTPYFISSSSIDFNDILEQRGNLFNQFTAINSEQVLKELHLQQDLKDTSSSILMKRELTHTKSISQVVIDNSALKYCYLTENNLKDIDINSPYKQCQNIKLQLDY